MKKSFITKTLLVAISIVTFNSCTYKSPAVEAEYPTEGGIPKSFFVASDVDAKSGKAVTAYKKFLCGWASEMEVGHSAEWFYTNNAIVPSHCNLVFEITEKTLYGKLVNPSFPNDPSRWEIALSIPIKSHYYEELEKDGAGRETNKKIRNSNRSHWSARPNLDLDLSGLDLEGVYRSTESYWGMRSMGNIDVNKVVWDLDNGYLGLTIQKGTHDGQYSRIRFNIKEFKTNPDFKPTPFNDKNYKKMNVLHIIGEKAQGIYPMLHGAHWDVSKKIEVRLWQVPDKYKNIMQEVVKDWNDALREAKATTLTDGPFVISETPAEYAFDLRYPTIAWVSDDKISTYSPLGIGMALADVKNGEIKWGMITIYAGYLEKYLKGNLDTTVGSGNTSNKFAQSLSEFLKVRINVDIPESIRALAYHVPIASNETVEKLAEYFMPASEMRSPRGGKKAITDDQIKLLQDKKFKEKKDEIGRSLQEIGANGSIVSQKSSTLIKSQLSQLGLDGLLKSKYLKSQKTISGVEFGAKANQKNAANVDNESQTQENIELKLIRKYSSPVTCTERTIGDVLPAWVKIVNENSTGKAMDSDEKVMRHMIKELTSHEFGHFIGLGHQFKENILPVKGTVPDAIYNKLAEKATEKNSYTNYTSVMGYRSPEVEFKDTVDVKPGPQDILVLRYLYSKQYATYKTGDADFTFFNVTQDGIIPEVNPEKSEYKTTYFPQCNDMQASLAIDPYCNRFDVGPNAKKIMEGYFKLIEPRLIQNLFAFTDARGGNIDEMEWYMYYRAYNTFGRVRIFYDYMRKYYKDEFNKIRNDEDALMQFSTACKTENNDEITNSNLKEMFSKNPELKDLCQANAIALEHIEKTVSINASDYTKTNARNQFMPGGLNGGDAERDWSRWMGSWEEMGAYPLKSAAMNALTLPSPWLMYGSWMYSHWYYDRLEDGYSYMYLYPKEYTKIMASNIKKNLTFASLGQGEKTEMGRSVLSMAWMNFTGNNMSNDAKYFSPRLVSKVRSQQDFNLGMVAVILTGVTREGGNAMNSVRWNGQVYDFASGRLTPLTSAFIMPGGDVIANAPQMFIYPITKFTPYSDFEGYFIAYRVEFSKDSDDGLSELSIKNDLKDYYSRLYDACVVGTDGADNGLASFFSVEEKEFEGFKMGGGLARSEESLKAFRESIDSEFKKYYASAKYKGENSVQPKPETCQQSLKGLGLIVTSAAALNGYWLPEIYDYIQK